MADPLLSPLEWAPPPTAAGDPEALAWSGPSLRIAPLDRLGLLWLQIRAPNPALLRQLEAALGCPLPSAPNTAAGTDPQALWTAPGEWLLVTAPERTAQLAAKATALVCATDISDSRAGVAIGGPQAAELLAKGCGLDFHPSAFGAGRCAGTRFAGIPALLHRPGDDPGFRLYVDRSYAGYLWHWLRDAAQEFTPAAAGAKAPQ